MKITRAEAARGKPALVKWNWTDAKCKLNTQVQMANPGAPAIRRGSARAPRVLCAGRVSRAGLAPGKPRPYEWFAVDSEPSWRVIQKRLLLRICGSGCSGLAL
jgi:hypothetical protein